MTPQRWIGRQSISIYVSRTCHLHTCAVWHPSAPALTNGSCCDDFLPPCVQVTPYSCKRLQLVHDCCRQVISSTHLADSSHTRRLLHVRVRHLQHPCFPHHHLQVHLQGLHESVWQCLRRQYILHRRSRQIRTAP